MELERIDDDTIRVFITNNDLKERNITLMELMSDQGEVEKLFYSILAEANIEEEFEQNEAVSFQVMPNKDGLEVFIMKNVTEDQIPKELLRKMMESRRGAELKDKVPEEVLNKLLETDGDKAQTANDRLDQHRDLAQDADEPTKTLTAKFDDFEALVQLAQSTQITGANRLVEYNQAYYLELNVPQSNSEQRMKNLKALLREYGEVTPVDISIAAEHGQIIFEQDALEQVQAIFS
ncbi:adaptor protein MecA [Weissella kandleri]|uniref:adaptor protein MecA n=1 Tax=Weissella kandleri TaxID=1616 RepID=UPI00387E8F11